MGYIKKNQWLAEADKYKVLEAFGENPFLTDSG
jgi:hypothetical protein